MSDSISRELAKFWWLRCVACSEAAMTTQMAGFGLKEPDYEQALHSFSGGFMHLGHTCGLLTGAALAAGFFARRHFNDENMQSTATLYATIQLAKALKELTGSSNCRDITEVSLTKLRGRLHYLQQGKARMCGRLHLRWAPQAHELITKSFSRYEAQHPEEDLANCAVYTLKKVMSSTGIRLESVVAVAGLAGGVGLLGNMCGALSTGVFALSAFHYLHRKNKKRDSRIKGSLEELVGTRYRGSATLLRLAFIDRFGSDLCGQIIGRNFKDMEDHSIFIKSGGCQELIDFIVKWINNKDAREWSTAET
jgi:C_GCAxxG_C_C family probable redox protein